MGVILPAAIPGKSFELGCYNFKKYRQKRFNDYSLTLSTKWCHPGLYSGPQT
jgi:hypothetical protein